MKTRAAILVKHNSPLILDELEIPQLNPKQVLVEIAYSGVCGTQIGEWRGTRGDDKYLPHCLGHEGSGRVIDIGSDVTRTRVGDDVVLSWIRPEGSSSGCSYLWGNTERYIGCETVNAGAITTFQHHAVLDENCVTKIPANCSMEEAALLGCAAATGMGVIFNVLKVARGQSVAVFGVGGVGLCAVMAAAFVGAYPIIAVDLNTERALIATKFGATHYSTTHVASSIVDFAVEATGKPFVMKSAIETVKPRGGKVVIIGNAEHGSSIDINTHTFNQGKSILGTWGGDAVPSRDFRHYAYVLKSFKTEELPTYYPLEKINEAMEDLAAGKVWRPFISMKAVT